MPPSGVKKNQISIAFAPVVREIDPPGYLKLPPAKATVRLGVPSLVKIKVKLLALLEFAFGLLNVSVALPFNVAVTTCPVEIYINFLTLYIYYIYKLYNIIKKIFFIMHFIILYIPIGINI